MNQAYCLIALRGKYFPACDHGDENVWVVSLEGISELRLSLLWLAGGCGTDSKR